MLRMAGFFPSVPTQVNFELIFAPVSGQWRLFGISVNIGQSAPVAPNPPPSAETKSAPAPKQSPSPASKPAPPANKPADNQQPKYQCKLPHLVRRNSRGDVAA